MNTPENSHNFNIELKPSQIHLKLIIALHTFCTFLVAWLNTSAYWKLLLVIGITASLIHQLHYWRRLHQYHRLTFQQCVIQLHGAAFAEPLNAKVDGYHISKPQLSLLNLRAENNQKITVMLLSDSSDFNSLRKLRVFMASAQWQNYALESGLKNKIKALHQKISKSKTSN